MIVSECVSLRRQVLIFSCRLLISASDHFKICANRSIRQVDEELTTYQSWYGCHVWSNCTESFEIVAHPSIFRKVFPLFPLPLAYDKRGVKEVQQDRWAACSVEQEVRQRTGRHACVAICCQRILIAVLSLPLVACNNCVTSIVAS